MGLLLAKTDQISYVKFLGRIEVDGDKMMHLKLLLFSTDRTSGMNLKPLLPELRPVLATFDLRLPGS